jgi:hypothetical protein
MKDKKGAPRKTASKSKKVSSRVTAANWEAAAAAGTAGQRAQWQAISQASVEQVAKRQFPEDGRAGVPGAHRRTGPAPAGEA